MKNNARSVDIIIFDLDGTLIDSKVDIANAVNHTLKSINVPELPNEKIYSYVGYGIEPLLRSAVGSAGNSITYEELLVIFKNFYKNHCLDNTTLFTGACNILDYYKDKKIVLLSNKTYEFVYSIMDGLKIKDKFDYIFGGDSFLMRKPDPSVITDIFGKFNYTIARKKAIIIGDSKVDIETGKNADILTCGATYGFRPKEEIYKASPDFIIENLAELKDHIF